MSIKYGPVICNPYSEEAKELVGKEIIGGWSYASLVETPDDYMVTTLRRIGRYKDPFEVDGSKFSFIREAIHDDEYIKYASIKEMLNDYVDRFNKGKPWPKNTLPPVWLKHKYIGNIVLLCEFNPVCNQVYIGSMGLIDLSSLFANYTYLDGTPVGKETKE